MRIGVTLAIAAVLGTEAGVPIPIPADVLLLGLGERAGADVVPLWVVMLALEAMLIAGTTLLFVLARRLGERVVGRLTSSRPRVAERIGRARSLLERRGRAGIVVGRATPGLRTLTVLVAASSSMPFGVALFALVVSSTVFVQAHVLLGYTVGPAARAALEGLPLLGVGLVVALVAAGLVVWLARRGRREGVAGWTEGTCPACLALGLIDGGRAQEPGAADGR